MKKIIIVSPKNRTVYNFRGDLIKKIISHGYKVIVTGPDLIDVDKIEKLGAEFRLMPLSKTGVNPIEDIKYYKGLKKLFKKERPNIVFSYTIKPNIYGSLAAKKAKVKKIYSMVTGAGYIFTATSLKAKIIKKISLMLYKRGLKASHYTIFQNNDDRVEFIRNKLIKEEKTLLVNGSGVNMEYFKKKPLPERTTFFMLARALKSKGVIEYLEAASKLKKKYPKVRFMYLGGIENMQDSITYEEIKPYIEQGIEYFDETSDVRPYYKQSSVFVLPSYREGTPRSVLEAMSTGRAIITTDAPGCKETVKDQITGYIVPVKEINSLIDAMEKFIKNPSLIQTMGEESYLYCKEKYDVNVVNKTMLEHLNIMEEKNEFI